MYLEINMIIRNKKPINNLFQIFFLYIFSIFVFIYLSKKGLNNSLMFFMIISLMSSSFILGHGIFLLTWESTYFYFFMTHNISLQSFFRAKHFLFIISAIMFSLINIPVMIIVKGNLLLYGSFLVFNIGFLPLLVISVSFFNNERASLDKSVFFNYEGYGMWQYMLFILELMLPGIIYMGISRVWSINGAMFILSLIGTSGLVALTFYPGLFFLSRKYQIILGFSQK